MYKSINLPNYPPFLTFSSHFLDKLPQLIPLLLLALILIFLVLHLLISVSPLPFFKVSFHLLFAEKMLLSLVLVELLGKQLLF